MLLKFIDSAFPLSGAIAGIDGVCGYAGGDTPHVWTQAEWDNQPYRYRLPIYVRSNPSAAIVSSDLAALSAQLQAIGAPRGCAIALDLETAIDVAYAREMTSGISGLGYVPMLYGSQADVLKDAGTGDLIWGADITGIPHIAVPDNMTQFIFNTSYDESVAESGIPFWDTKAPVREGSIMVPAICEMDGLYIFYIGTDRQAYYIPPGGSPASAISIGGKFAGGLSVIATPDGVITVAGIGTDNCVYTQVFSSGKWNGKWDVKTTAVLI